MMFSDRVLLSRCASIVTPLVLAGLFTACSQAPIRPESGRQGDYAYTRSYLEWFIPRQMAKHDVPGVSIALVDDQNVIWAKGFGYADVRARQKAGADTVYRVGSIAKLLTASAAMQLREQGKLDIDAPLADVLPGFRVRSRFKNIPPVTPRSIMTHHSGLPADILKGMWTQGQGESFTSVVDQLQTEYLAYPPDHIYSYSNVAVSLLGHAIQTVSRQSFEDYIDQNLVRPMGMTHTGFKPSDNMRPLLARGYSDSGVIETGNLRDLPAGGLYSNVNDLAQLMKMVFAQGRSGDRQILKPATLNEMLRQQNKDVALDFNFQIGLGWFLVKHGLNDAGPVASHGGGTPCYFSQLITLPAHKLGVVVLANSCSSGSTVADTATLALKLALESKTGVVRPLENKLAKAPLEQEPTLKQLDELQGRYATWLGLIDVKRKGKRLQAKLSGWNFDLLPHTDGTFSIQFKLFGLFNIRDLYGIDLDNVLLKPVDTDGHHVIVMNFKGRDQIFGERVTPQPVPKSWLARLGALEIINPDEYMRFRDNRLAMDDGIMVMRYRLKMPVLPEQSAALPIMPISDTEAVIMGLGRGLGETVQIIQQDGEEILRFSGYDAHWTAYDTPHPLTAQHAETLAHKVQAVPVKN
ncbi:MAG: serine hydrolase domain-containing protein [Gammaproteobacteria bacterium]|nr:MAG: serine hydrolase domain-containing protein [Gammaproteobacteria bacterium]